MGDKITRPAGSSDVVHARELTDALQRGHRSLFLPSQPSRKPSAEIRSKSPEDGPEVQRAHLEQLVECAPEAISILDPGHQIMRVNGEFTRMFGYLPEEALGRRIESLIVPPDRSSETNWISEVLKRGQKVSLETKRQRKDGSLFDVFIAGAPVLVNGDLVAIYALYRDITEQKRAEALNSALYRIAERASSAKDLQQFFEAIHGIVSELMYARNFYIALYDPDTKLLSFPYFVDEEDSPPARKQLGRGLTEYVLRSGEALLCSQEVFDRMVERGEVELIGAPSVDWLGVPLKTTGQTFGVVVLQSYNPKVRFRKKDKDVLTFVSQQLASAIEHKRNEEALCRSEARYRSLVQSAVYGIYRSDPSGKFLDVNPALVNMLGYNSAEEVLALDPDAVLVDPQEHKHYLQGFHRDSGKHSVEARWKRQDGKVITVRLSGQLINADSGSPAALEMIAEDVTEKRMLEEQFRQAQKMEAVGRLAGGVAHDFNNLLTVISGYTEVLLEQVGPVNPLRTRIDAIHQAAERASRLTRQLLAFSRKQMLELRVVDINAIVANMERLLRPLIGEHIELTTRLAADAGRTRADAGQIEQVIMNLVVNAKDAMPAGGNINIQTSPIEVDDNLLSECGYMQPGRYVLLSVTDNGEGMDKETQARIFEPFFTTKEKGKGTGLGLSTVYGIVKQSGGYLLTQSEPGQGTTFSIYLPRVEEAQETEEPLAVSQKDDINSGTILLVEDEESVRQLVRETLSTKGYKILEADSGPQALRLASQYGNPIDMLITDVVMPGMGGRELAAQLCASRPEIKVLYLSGYSEDAIVLHGVLDPGTAFLQKPFMLQTLSRKVRDVLRAARQ